MPASGRSKAGMFSSMGELGEDLKKDGAPFVCMNGLTVSWLSYECEVQYASQWRRGAQKAPACAHGLRKRNLTVLAPKISYQHYLNVVVRGLHKNLRCMLCGSF